MVPDNEVLMSEFNDLKKVWDKYQAAVEQAKKDGVQAPPPPKHPKTGAVMKGPPKKPKLREQILVCRGGISNCITPGSDVGSSCPAKCINKETGKRYDCTGANRECQCPICKSVCNAAWYLKDHGKIILSLIKLSKTGLLDRDQESSVTSLQRFLRVNANAGVLAADAVLEKHDSTVTRDNAKAHDEMCSQLVWEGMAGAMARTATDLPLNTRRELGKVFGTDTDVELPSGRKIDTRQLNQQRRGKHGRNNRMATKKNLKLKIVDRRFDHGVRRFGRNLL